MPHENGRPHQYGADEEEDTGGARSYVGSVLYDVDGTPLGILRENRGELGIPWRIGSLYIDGGSGQRMSFQPGTYLTGGNTAIQLNERGEVPTGGTRALPWGSDGLGGSASNIDPLSGEGISAQNALADHAASLELRLLEARQRGDRETELLLLRERERIDEEAATAGFQREVWMNAVREAFTAKENALDRENAQRLQAAQELGSLRRTVLQNQAEARRLMAQMGNQDPFRAAAALQGGLLAGTTPNDTIRTSLGNAAYGDIPGMNVNPYTAPMEQVGQAITGLEQRQQLPPPPPNFAPIGMAGGGQLTIHQDAPTPNISGPTGVGVLVGEKGPEVMEITDHGVRVIPLATRGEGGLAADWSGLANRTPEEQTALIIMDEAAKRGLNHEFAALTGAAESGLNPYSAGDTSTPHEYTGLFQLGPEHQRMFFEQGYTNLHDPRQQASYVSDFVRRTGNWNQFYGAGRVVGAAGMSPNDGTTYTGPLYHELGPLAPYVGSRTPIGGAGGLTATPRNTPLGMPQETTTQGVQQQPTVQTIPAPRATGPMATPFSAPAGEPAPIQAPGTPYDGLAPETGAPGMPEDEVRFLDDLSRRWPNVTATDVIAAGQYGMFGVKDIIASYLEGGISAEEAYKQLKPHIPNIPAPGTNNENRVAMSQAIQQLWIHLGLPQAPFTEQGALGSPQFSGWPGQTDGAPPADFARTALDRLGVQPRLFRMADTGQVYVVDEQGKAHAITSPGFASAAELRYLGFNPGNIMEVTSEEFQNFTSGISDPWLLGQEGNLDRVLPMLNIHTQNPGTEFEQYPNLQVPMREPVTGLLLPQPRMIAALLPRLDPVTQELIMSAYQSAGIYNPAAIEREARAYTPVGTATGAGGGFLR